MKSSTNLSFNGSRLTLVRIVDRLLNVAPDADGCESLWALITALPYMAIQSKNASDFAFFFFFNWVAIYGNTVKKCVWFLIFSFFFSLGRKMGTLSNRIFPIAPLVSTVPLL